MADSELKRSILSAQPKRRRLNPNLKTRVYQEVYILNRGFAVALAALDRLEKLAVFRRDYLKAYRNMAEELRARINTELTETLRDRERKRNSTIRASSSEVGEEVYAS